METNPIFIAEMSSDKKYYLKAVTGTQNSSRTTITTYPTTEGTPMSDNAYREPYTITITLTSSELNKSKNIVDTENENALATDMKLLRDIFFNWKENYTRLIIQTRHKQYTNMIVTDISWNDNNSNLGKFDPTVQLTECRVASIYTEIQGPFKGYESEPTYTPEQYHGNSNGLSITGTLGGVAAGALIGAKIGGVLGHPIIGAVVGGVGGAIFAFGKGTGWW